MFLKQSKTRTGQDRADRRPMQVLQPGSYAVERRQTLPRMNIRANQPPLQRQMREVASSNRALGDQPLTLVAGAARFPHAALILSLAIACNTILTAGLPTRTRYGAEAGRIAASIAEGNGFSSPFAQLATGPSAWIPPAYPYLLAGIFRIFGVFSLASYWAAIGFNIIVHAVCCVLLYKVAGRVFGRLVGCCSAYALATFPLLFYPLVLLHFIPANAVVGARGLFILPNNIWYNYLTELVILVLILYTLDSPHWSIYGIAWGAGMLTNPGLLVLAPAFGAHVLTQRQRKSRQYLGLAVCVAGLCTLPWLTRNYLVFHRLIPIRDNFGVQLKVGNQPGEKGLWKHEVFPDSSLSELNRLAELGEAEYDAEARKEALQIIHAHPSEFVGNTIRRVGYWWFGIPVPSERLGNLRFLKNLPLSAFSALAFYGVVCAWRSRNRGAFLFVVVLLFYPMVYYVTHTYSLGYMYPIHPEMLALAAFALVGEKAATSPLMLTTGLPGQTPT